MELQKDQYMDEERRESLANRLGYLSSSDEAHSAVRGYVAAKEGRPLDLWTIRSSGDLLFEQGKVSRGELEGWIRRNQTACRKGYMVQLESSVLFDGMVETVKVVK